MEIGTILEQAVAVLRPTSLGDFMVWGVFIFCIMTLVAIPEKNVVPPYLIYITMLACIIDLVRSAGGQALGNVNQFQIGGESLLGDRGFLTFLLHIIMFLFPIVAGAMTRKHGRKGGYALPLGLTTGIIGGMYAFGAFFLPNAIYARIL